MQASMAQRCCRLPWASHAHTPWMDQGRSACGAGRRCRGPKHPRQSGTYWPRLTCVRMGRCGWLTGQSGMGQSCRGQRSRGSTPSTTRRATQGRPPAPTPPSPPTPHPTTHPCAHCTHRVPARRFRKYEINTRLPSHSCTAVGTNRLLIQSFNSTAAASGEGGENRGEVGV